MAVIAVCPYVATGSLALLALTQSQTGHAINELAEPRIKPQMKQPNV